MLKWLGRIAIIIVLLLVFGAVGGWFWIQSAMKPQPNEAQVASGVTQVSITWTENAFSDRSGLFVPVQIPGVDETFFMQLDIGSELTLLYGPAINSLFETYSIDPWTTDTEDETYLTEVDIVLGALDVEFRRVRVIDFGRPLTEQRADFQIIGTLGADVLRRKTVALDFAQSNVTFGDAGDFTWPSGKIAEIRSVRGWTQIEANMGGDDTWLMWDTGASSFQLLTDETTWNAYETSGGTVRSVDTLSWGRPVVIHLKPVDETIRIGDQDLPLTEVALAEGFPWFVQTLMRFSGMEGMLGNEVFRDHVILLDITGGKVAILDPAPPAEPSTDTPRAEDG